MINIKYFNSFSSQNKNIIIFISKISELSKISLPSTLPFNIKDTSIKKILKKNKVLDIFYSENKSINYRYIFKIVDLNDSSKLNIGASIYPLFDYEINKDITFVFSSYIKSKNSSIISEIVFGYILKSYKFNKYKNEKKFLPKNLHIYKSSKRITDKINYNLNLTNSINFVKDLVSEPANILTPEAYSNKCLNLNIKGLKIKVLNKIQLERIGMTALLGVSQGSINEPKVVVFEWNTQKKIKPILLVGKGVTFDTGGISLKPSSGMEEMITDMGGSAVVVGSMMNAALNKSKKSIVGIIGLVENMPDGKAQRPGDIINSLSKKTIEILNTDAEGRLVLADIITYAQKKYNPSQIIDFATLTGAIMIALGTHKAGLFSNNDKLAKKIQNAGDITGEKVWRLPLGSEYDKEINSSRADMINIGSTRYGGSIHAAQFINRFIKDNIPWAHLDIAGVSWSMKGGQYNITKIHNPGATAFGVRLIDQLLKGK